jgi:SNF2 family DNA or RNA helicase
MKHIIDTKAIKEHINNKSSSISISRAKSIDPYLESSNENFFVFTCESSSTDEMYEIEVVFNETNKIKTSCECLFSTSNTGLCKHIIASLNYIIDEQKLKIENTKNMNNLQPNQILLLEGFISDNTYSYLNTNGYYYYDYLIENVNLPRQITTKSKNYDSNIQTFEYDTETSILKLTCTCKSTLKKCNHLYKALTKIYDTFGYNVFKEDYVKTKTLESIKKLGFSEDDNYNEIFSFEVTSKGFEAKSKYKNIQNQAIDFTNVFQNEELELKFDLPIIKQNHDFALGIIFDFYRKDYRNLQLIQGKLNKQRTDFSSTLNIITNEYLNHYIDKYNSEDNQKLIYKTLQVKGIEKESHQKLYSENLINAVKIIKELLPIWQKNFIFKFNSYENLVRKNLIPFQIIEKPIKLIFKFSENNYFYNLKAKIVIDEKEYNLNSSEFIISTFFLIFSDHAVPILDPKLIVYLKNFQNQSELNYNKKNVPDFLEKVLTPLTKKFEVHSILFKNNKTIFEDEVLEKHVYIKDIDGEFITFTLAVQYPNQLINVFSLDKLIEKTDSKYCVTERNQSFEDNFIEDFTSLHPIFQEQTGLFYLEPEQIFQQFWLLNAVENMKQKGIKVFGANDLKSFKFNLNKPVINVNLKSGTDWFDLEIEVSFGKQIVSLKDIQKSIIKKTNYVTLGDGTIGILAEDWVNKFSNYFKTGEIKKNSIQISNYQFGIIDELYNEMENKPTFLQELYDKKQRLQNISEIENVAIPKGIKAKLRDYQHHGLNWMAFLHKNQLGGCLADDMGLGKTLQTITFLQYLKTTEKAKNPSLIIAPTSLIFNWMAEIEKFCPTLKIHSFVGSTRATNTDNFNKFDIIISTYGSLLNDVEFLKDYKFNYIILDESQAIKNPNSKRYKAVRLLNSYNKMVLTGTPIENNTFDLYAQLNFLNPGLLGNMSHFKTNFSDAIDKEKDFDTSILLSKIIAPFVLRRTKEQVAKELPDKTESIIYCDMSKEQRNVYEVFKNKYKDYLLNKIDENGAAKSQMYILEGLTKLRQICNSTELINEEADYGNYSAKLEILLENIKEKTGNHKILVFSQFVKMLQIVKNKLDEEKITYEYLDGQTKNRQENVNNFQENKDVRVFLISLKAGGTGLNLTEADYVFIIDPWWNPAVENQAIDRCYRIGQTKQVMAYRMICRDTIEEKIVILQSKKKSVANSIITIDDEKKSFDINEVKELFS